MTIKKTTKKKVTKKRVAKKTAVKKKVVVKRGTPTKYNKRFIDEVYQLCLLGANDLKIARFFKVNTATIYRWKNKYPDFCESIRAGKEKYDTNEVESALLERAKGYTHDDVHISNYKGQVTITKIKKHYPPDTKAAIHWLHNRDSKRWKNRIEHKHEIVEKPINEMTDAELEKELEKERKKTR